MNYWVKRKEKIRWGERGTEEGKEGEREGGNVVVRYFIVFSVSMLGGR